MTADYIRYLIDRLRVRSDNRQIQLLHLDISFPPSYLAYDAYSSNSHRWYLESGAGAAKAIWGMLAPLMPNRDDGKLHTVVEWGRTCAHHSSSAWCFQRTNNMYWDRLHSQDN